MPPLPPPLPPPPPAHIPSNPHMLEANGHQQGKPESPTLIVILNGVNTLTQLFLGAVMFSAFTIANVSGYTNSFTQHVYLCVFGYVILMSQAILSFNTHAGWAYSLKYPDKRMIHGFMQILGSILAIVGGIIKIANLNEHFHTAHSITGIIALLLTFLILIGGILNFVVPSKMSTVLFKTVHVCIGSLTISVAFLCLCLGFNDRYKFHFGDNNGNLAISFTVFALAGILISAFSRSIFRIVYGGLK